MEKMKIHTFHKNVYLGGALLIAAIVGLVMISSSRADNFAPGSQLTFNGTVNSIYGNVDNLAISDDVTDFVIEHTYYNPREVRSFFSQPLRAITGSITNSVLNTQTIEIYQNEVLLDTVNPNNITIEIMKFSLVPNDFAAAALSVIESSSDSVRWGSNVGDRSYSLVNGPVSFVFSEPISNWGTITLNTPADKVVAYITDNIAHFDFYANGNLLLPPDNYSQLCGGSPVLSNAYMAFAQGSCLMIRTNFGSTTQDIPARFEVRGEYYGVAISEAPMAGPVTVHFDATGWDNTVKGFDLTGTISQFNLVPESFNGGGPLSALDSVKKNLSALVLGCGGPGEINFDREECNITTGNIWSFPRVMATLHQATVWFQSEISADTTIGASNMRPITQNIGISQYDPTECAGTEGPYSATLNNAGNLTVTISAASGGGGVLSNKNGRSNAASVHLADSLPIDDCAGSISWFSNVGSNTRPHSQGPVIFTLPGGATNFNPFAIPTPAYKVIADLNNNIASFQFFDSENNLIDTYSGSCNTVVDIFSLSDNAAASAALAVREDGNRPCLTINAQFGTVKEDIQCADTIIEDNHVTCVYETPRANGESVTLDVNTHSSYLGPESMQTFILNAVSTIFNDQYNVTNLPGLSIFFNERLNTTINAILTINVPAPKDITVSQNSNQVGSLSQVNNVTLTVSSSEGGGGGGGTCLVCYYVSRIDSSTTGVLTPDFGDSIPYNDPTLVDRGITLQIGDQVSFDLDGGVATNLTITFRPPVDFVRANKKNMAASAQLAQLQSGAIVGPVTSSPEPMSSISIGTTNTYRFEVDFQGAEISTSSCYVDWGDGSEPTLADLIPVSIEASARLAISGPHAIGSASHVYTTAGSYVLITDCNRTPNVIVNSVTVVGGGSGLDPMYVSHLFTGIGFGGAGTEDTISGISAGVSTDYSFITNELADFSPNPPSSLTCTINWGDGETTSATMSLPDQPPLEASATLAVLGQVNGGSGTHTYSSAGTYIATVNCRDPLAPTSYNLSETGSSVTTIIVGTGTPQDVVLNVTSTSPSSASGSHNLTTNGSAEVVLSTPQSVWNNGAITLPAPAVKVIVTAVGPGIATFDFIDVNGASILDVNTNQVSANFGDVAEFPYDVHNFFYGFAKFVEPKFTPPDTDAPVISNNEATPQTVYIAPFTVSGTVVDAGSGVDTFTITHNGDQINPVNLGDDGSYLINVTLVVGLNTFSEIACDNDGNCSEPTVKLITYIPDQDRDGDLDPVDNCLTTPNPTQADIDNDGQGDECEPFSFAPGGVFAVGNITPHNVGDKVYFWGAQWWKKNKLSAPDTVPAFKGYENTVATPTCGDIWSTDPGNSSKPPAPVLPEYMAVVVPSKVSKKGSVISGNTSEVVIVYTKNSGYVTESAANPGHEAIGPVVRVLCKI